MPSKSTNKAKRAVTMAHVAARANVSVGTVSHVLNGTAKVKELLRRRVERAVEELKYSPSALARGLSRSRTEMIALLIPDVAHPLFHSIADRKLRERNQLDLCRIAARHRYGRNSDRAPRFKGLAIDSSLAHQTC